MRFVTYTTRGSKAFRYLYLVGASPRIVIQTSHNFPILPADDNAALVDVGLSTQDQWIRGRNMHELKAKTPTNCAFDADRVLALLWRCGGAVELLLYRYTKLPRSIYFWLYYSSVTSHSLKNINRANTPVKSKRM